MSIPQHKKTVQRSAWLLVLLIVAGSIAYPRLANLLLREIQGAIGINFGGIRTPFVLGLDLQGGTHLEYEADVSKVSNADRSEALSGVRDVIERRVNAMGVAEPLIQTTQAGQAWRVTVELAGVRDISQAIKMIGETPILEFKEQNNELARPMTAEEKKSMDAKNAAAKKRADDLLAQARKSGADFTALAQKNTEDAALKDAGGDAGFIRGNAVYQDILSAVRELPAGSVLGKVLEREHSYAIVKVEEIKQTGTEMQAHHLLIGYKGARGNFSVFTREEALAKINTLKSKATPQNFDALVADNSQEPGAVVSKGDLGWFTKDEAAAQFNDPFANALAAQSLNTVSSVIESPYGYHLILKLGERPIKDVRVRMIELKKLTPEDLVPAPDPWKGTKLTGKQLSSARVDFDQRTGSIEVALQFNSEGAKLFGDITARNVGKPVAIFLDGRIISQPVVQNEILGGQAVITGNFSVDEAKLLARRLQAGALPVPIKLIAQQTVGPTLGADSLKASLVAGLIGFLLVALYMIALYRLPGIISIAALILYAAVSSAIFKLIPVTLTLSGIAGFILSLGIAVDANVLVFERLKEEWLAGKTLSTALEDAFKRAWLSIRDGHATVLISSVVLYWFSSSTIRGFAVTLMIGTLLSLFTAVVSTRTILRLLAGTKIGANGWLWLRPKKIEGRV